MSTLRILIYAGVQLDLLDEILKMFMLQQTGPIDATEVGNWFPVLLVLSALDAVVVLLYDQQTLVGP